MKFSDIKPYTRCAGYMVNVGLDYLPDHYTRYVREYNLDVNPDFQRGNVWTEQQKIRFIEHMLRGGQSGRDIYVNCPEWNSTNPTRECVLVDGKQRLDAALGFLNNEFPAFGTYYKDFEGSIRTVQGTFNWHVNDLATREEVLQWYLDLNSGGTIHTDEELTRVRSLLANKVPYQVPSTEEVQAAARFDRAIIQAVVADHDAEEAARAERARLHDEARAKAPKKRARATR